LLTAIFSTIPEVLLSKVYSNIHTLYHRPNELFGWQMAILTKLT
jgi:hypothetical protein